MDRSDLATRMKVFYEQVPKTKLMRRCPVIIRLDGRAFHTFTRGFQKPFDEVLIKTMQETTKYLCENIQGCVLGYTQSDEITLVLVDYKKLTSSAWFDNEVQKMCSISASMATVAFNRIFREVAKRDYSVAREICIGNTGNSELADKKYKVYEDVFNKAMFDSRCFNIPKEEVTNNIYWRQLDASRNSIQMLGQAHFSHKKLQNKSCSDIQDMLMTEKGINWNDLSTYQKRGTCVIRKQILDPKDKSISRSCWDIDEDIPIFKGVNREYIDKLVYIGEQ